MAIAAASSASSSSSITPDLGSELSDIVDLLAVLFTDELEFDADATDVDIDVDADVDIDVGADIDADVDDDVDDDVDADVDDDVDDVDDIDADVDADIDVDGPLASVAFFSRCLASSMDIFKTMANSGSTLGSTD